MTLDEVRVLLRFKDQPQAGCYELNGMLDVHLGASRIASLSCGRSKVNCANRANSVGSVWRRMRPLMAASCEASRMRRGGVTSQQRSPCARCALITF